MCPPTPQGEEDDFVFDGIFRHHLSDIPRIHINDL